MICSPTGGVLATSEDLPASSDLDRSGVPIELEIPGVSCDLVRIVAAAEVVNPGISCDLDRNGVAIEFNCPGNSFDLVRCAGKAELEHSASSLKASGNSVASLEGRLISCDLFRGSNAAKLDKLSA